MKPLFSGSQGGSGGTNTVSQKVSIGTVTTVPPGSPAKVTDSGTGNKSILDFQIPQGAVGPAGPQGDQGPQGIVNYGKVLAYSIVFGG